MLVLRKRCTLHAGLLCFSGPFEEPEREMEGPPEALRNRVRGTVRPFSPCFPAAAVMPPPSLLSPPLGGVAASGMLCTALALATLGAVCFMALHTSYLGDYHNLKG